MRFLIYLFVSCFLDPSDEYLNYALRNRQEWEERGREVVAEMVEEVKTQQQDEINRTNLHGMGGDDDDDLDEPEDYLDVIGEEETFHDERRSVSGGLV